MSNEIQLGTSANLPAMADPLQQQDSQEQPGVSPFQKLHAALRGRYHWCAVLTLLGMIGGGLAGYKVAQPVYISGSMVRIESTVRGVLTGKDEVLPMLESFVQAQVALIRSRRVMDAAMSSDTWKKLNRPYNDQSIAAFAQDLSVDPSREIITVTFKDPEPAATEAAVKSVLDAYFSIFVESQIKDQENRQKVLEDRRLALTTELKMKRDAIQEAAREFGTDDLRDVHRMKMQTIERLEQALADVKMALAAAAKTDGKSPQADKGAEGQLSLAELAERHPGVRELLREQRALRDELAIRQRTLGTSHPRLADLQARVAAKDREVEEYARELRQAIARAPLGPTAATNTTAALAGATVEQLQTQLARYEEMRTAARAEAMRMGRAMMEIEKLHKEEEELSQRLTEIKRRLESMAMEASPVSRIQRVAERPDPAVIFKDSRKQISGMAALFGGSLGFGVILLISLMDRRVRSPGDAASDSVQLPLLGIMPTLPEDLADPEQAAIAAQCVHQIRTLMQVGAEQSKSRVFAVTSPTAGSGKTSLTLGLGISFATAGSKTLLIDCDILGGGLTARVDAIIRRRIGQILLRAGHVTPQQIDAALRLANESHKRLGEILVELGFVTDDNVAEALLAQEHSPVGLGDALSGEEVDACIAETGIPGLQILPLGSLGPADASRLSVRAVRELVDRLQGHYDVVLIDTGPIPGSLEASVAVVAADGVVLVVSRGDYRPLARQSIRYLREIGSRIIGMVFNRAEGRDVATSFASQRYGTVSRRSMQAPPSRRPTGSFAPPPTREARIAPIASVIVGGFGNNGNGNHAKDDGESES